MSIKKEDKEYQLDSLIDFNFRFEGFYIEYFDKGFKTGGKIKTPLFNLIDAILSFKWIDQFNQNQEIRVHGKLDLDDSTPFNAKFGIDTSNCTQDITRNWLSLEVGNYKFVGYTNLNAQSNLEGKLYVDLPYNPQPGDDSTWIISVDNNNQSLTTTTLQILREEKGRGLDITVNDLKADNFWISGTYEYFVILEKGIWIPKTLDHGGYLEFIDLIIAISLGNSLNDYEWYTIWDGREVIVDMEREDTYEVLPGQAVGFQAVTYGGLPPYSYSWTFPPGTVSNQLNSTFTFNAEGTYSDDVVVIVRRGNAGRATATIYVAGQIFGNNPL